MMLLTSVPSVVPGTAELSPCLQYRYSLTRELRLPMFKDSDLIRILWVMLNPSTGDAMEDDRTIAKCMRFTLAFGGQLMSIGNAYGLRSTDPKVLRTHVDPVGPENDEWLRTLSVGMSRIIVAWGANIEPERERQVARILRTASPPYRRLWCLGTTRGGHPKHPLYLRNSTGLVEWTGCR